MRMWLACLVLLCAAYRNECAVQPGPKPDPSAKEVKLISISRIVKAANALNVCYDKTADLTGVTKKTLDLLIDGSTIIEKTLLPLGDQDGAGDFCLNFDGDIVEFKSKKLLFILEGRNNDDHPLIYGKATFSTPGAFLDDGDVTAVHKVGAIARDDSLRLESTKALTDWSVCVDDTINENLLVCDDASTLCYAIEVGASTESYKMCIKTTDTDGVTILSTTTLPAPTPTTEWPDNTADPLEVLLTYGYTPDLNRKKPEAVAATMKIISTSATNLEFVPYNSAAVAYAFCKEAMAECNLETYNNGNGDLQILIVDVKTGNKAVSNLISFKDYGITGTHLGDTIIEVYWTKDGDHSFYGANIVDADALGDILQTVVTDCSADGETTCFAYFVAAAAPSKETTYLSTVAPNTKEDTTYDPIMTNQIRAEPIILVPSRILGITLLQNPSYADGVLQVCYKASEINHNNTRDETILIDEDGHWIKIHQSTQVEDLISCFSPVNLLTSSLRINKGTKLTAVIVERELSGYQVLASGQADIDLSALRVIKPETDDSNNGYMRILAIVGAAVGGVACSVALVAAAILFVMKRKKNNDGLQYPLHRSNIEGSDIIHGLDNPNSTM